MTAKTWPELGIELYDHLTSRNSEITYEFDNMEIDVPSGTGDEVHHALWKLNGIISIRTRNLEND